MLNTTYGQYHLLLAIFTLEQGALPTKDSIPCYLLLICRCQLVW